MAREGITPAGHAGFEVDISREEVETLLGGFLNALVEEQRRGKTGTLQLDPAIAHSPLPAVGTEGKE